MTEENELVQEQPVQEEQVQEQVVQEEPVKETPKNDVDKNWQEANRLLRLQQQKIQELEHRLNTQPEPEEEDELDDLDPEEYMTVGKARKLAEKIADKKASQATKKAIQEFTQQQHIQNDEQRMRNKFEDYDYVIENYALPLIKTDPALAYRIQQSKNPAETAYKLGKLSDQYEETTQKQNISPKAEKILKNSQRPVSANAVGTPLKGQADQFSKMSKAEIWNMSEKFARGG